LPTNIPLWLEHVPSNPAIYYTKLAIEEQVLLQIAFFMK